MADDGESSSSSTSSSISLSSTCQDFEDSCEQPLKKARSKWLIKGNCDETQGETPKCTNDCLKNYKEASYSGCSRFNEARPVVPHPPIYNWQTQQFTKAVIDNTINKVIEDMGFVPLPLEAQDLMDNLFPINRRDEHVEDEAVLMAIQSHGLHQKDRMCSCSYSEPSKFKQNSDPFSLRASQNWYEYENDENTNVVVISSSSTNGSSSKQQESTFNNNSSSQSSNENRQLLNLEKDNLLDKNTYEHDFLAQAVAVAIQKKGLGTYLTSENR